MNNFSLTDIEKKMLLEAARETIDAILSDRKPVYSDYPDKLNEKYGAFVTLHKNSRLRGCIGNLYSVKPLFQTIKEMAAASAFHDPRFPAVTLKEAAEIDIEISVLSPMKKIKSADEIEPGKHGIFIQKGFKSGTLLPQVAAEQGWNREIFLNQTFLKAGLDPGDINDPDTEIFIYSAEVFGENQ